MRKINELRREIEEIDEEILRLISARLKLSNKIAKKKQKTGIPLEDYERETQLEELWTRKAIEFGIGTVDVQKILQDLLNLSKKEQKKLFIKSRKSGKKCANLSV